MTATMKTKEITVRETNMNDGVTIDMVLIDEEWIPSFGEFIHEKEGTEEVLEPWLTDRLDLPSDRGSVEGVAKAEYDVEAREWRVEINCDGSR